MPKTGGPEKSGGDAFETVRGKFRGFRSAVGQIGGGEFHFRKLLRQLRVRLVRSSFFTGQIARGRPTHTKRKNWFAGYPVQKQRVAVLGYSRDDIHPLAIAS